MPGSDGDDAPLEQAADFAFTRAQRLLSASEYRSVFSDVQLKAGQAEFVLLARPAPVPHSRLGLAIARKHLRRAVARNALKRMARETFRHLPESQPPLDIVLLSRPAAANSDRARLRAGLEQQFRRLHRQAARHT